MNAPCSAVGFESDHGNGKQSGDDSQETEQSDENALPVSGPCSETSAAGNDSSGAARKFFERGSCCDLGVVDPLERLGRFTMVLDEVQHAGNE